MKEKYLNTNAAFGKDIGKWHNNVDHKHIFGAILTELSKAFDCLSHDIIIAKLNAYGFDMKTLNFIYDFLRNRK